MRKRKLIDGKVKKLALMAVLTAVALIIFIIEVQFPLPVPIPGVKLGLANAVTLFALFFGSGSSNDAAGKAPAAHVESEVKDENDAILSHFNVFIMLLCRIILGAVFSGRLVALAYSFTGGLLGFAAQIALKRFVTRRQIWVCGAVGGVFHNVGQIIAAAVVTGTAAVMIYLPVLIVAGVFASVITGLGTQFAIERMSIKNK